MTGAELIAAERQRQIVEEGHNPIDDLDYTHGQLRRAALCYLFSAPIHRLRMPAPMWWPPQGVPATWPWDREHWKPTSTIADLTKAGALIAAELDRLLATQRATSHGSQDGGV